MGSEQPEVITREMIDELEAALADEESAHAETLTMWEAAKQKLTGLEREKKNLESDLAAYRSLSGDGKYNACAALIAERDSLRAELPEVSHA